MIEIDGAQGEGGGQIVRSSLALSTLTQQPIRLKRIRAGRKKPGLMRQHLACVRAASAICDARVEGNQIGSRELVFEPGAVRGGEFAFQVGTAGSTCLIAQTILPALMLTDEPSTVSLEGGTHNPWAPSFDFLREAFLPQLNRMGPRVEVVLESYGFYPAGGGKFQMHIAPATELVSLELPERSEILNRKVTAVVSGIPKSVGERECNTIRRRTGWPEECFHVIEDADPRGSGNVVLIQLDAKELSEVFIGIGKPGTKAEHVARNVLKAARNYIASKVPVGEFLADQLLLPMGIAASYGQSSCFRTIPLSMHSRTHIDVLQTFLPIDIAVTEREDSSVFVAIRPR